MVQASHALTTERVRTAQISAELRKVQEEKEESEKVVEVLQKQKEFKEKEIKQLKERNRRLTSKHKEEVSHYLESTWMLNEESTREDEPSELKQVSGFQMN